jgi:hypothetical protein
MPDTRPQASVNEDSVYSFFSKVLDPALDLAMDQSIFQYLQVKKLKKRMVSVIV